jgi:hypothetical protein
MEVPTAAAAAAWYGWNGDGNAESAARDTTPVVAAACVELVEEGHHHHQLEDGERSHAGSLPVVVPLPRSRVDVAVALGHSQNRTSGGRIVFALALCA